MIPTAGRMIEKKIKKEGNGELGKYNSPIYSDSIKRKGREAYHIEGGKILEPFEYK